VNDFDHVLHMPVGDERERCAIPSLESAHHAVVVVDGIRSRLARCGSRATERTLLSRAYSVWWTQCFIPGRLDDRLVDGTVELDIMQLLVAPKMLDHLVTCGPHFGGLAVTDASACLFPGECFEKSEDCDEIVGLLPAPRFGDRRTSRSTGRTLSASRSGVRDTPKRVHNFCSGIRCPGVSSPSTIMARMSPASSSCRGLRGILASSAISMPRTHDGFNGSRPGTAAAAWEPELAEATWVVMERLRLHAAG
jgi:hypothetical protein